MKKVIWRLQSLGPLTSKAWTFMRVQGQFVYSRLIKMTKILSWRPRSASGVYLRRTTNLSSNSDWIVTKYLKTFINWYVLPWSHWRYLNNTKLVVASSWHSWREVSLAQCCSIHQTYTVHTLVILSYCTTFLFRWSKLSVRTIKKLRPVCPRDTKK